MDKKVLRDKFYEATRALYDEGWIYSDLKSDNMSIDIYGKFKFIDLETLYPAEEKSYMQVYGYTVNNIDQL